MKTSFIALLLLFGLTPAFALNVVTGGAGTSGADFLTVGVGARPLAMGGAFAAVDTGADANAANWNPAALALVDKAGVTASYNSLFVDENQGYVGYAAPARGGGTWSAGLNYLVVAGIEKRAGDTENPDSSFSNQNFALGASYARSFGEVASGGVTLKYVRAALDSLKENAMAADAGLLSRTPLENVTAGVAVRNFGSNIGPDSMPLTFKGGVAYKALGGKLLLAGDVDWIATERRGYVSAGGEFWIAPNLAARAGYQFGHGPDQLRSKLAGLGAGLGLKLGRFALDYAFQPYGDLGNTHHLTLGIRFD